MHYQTQAALLLDEGTAFTQASGTRALPLPAEPLDVIVIGGGQAGLSVGYHLKQRGLRFVIVDASERVGDSWRRRWDSLRLFTPAWLDSLDGLPFPAAAFYFPTKDEMGDYLESYAAHFELPVLSDARVTSLERGDGRYVVCTSRGVLRAPQVIVAMSSYQRRRLPPFARDLDPAIVQLHSSEYLRPDQLARGAVLIAGAGNSGAEIGMDLAKNGRRVLLGGRDVGHVPFKITSFWGRWLAVRLLLRVVFHRLLTIRTPLGRKARPKLVSQGGPLIRQKPADLARAGIERATLTLHVGYGTFKPIRTELVEEHVVDPEPYEISAAAADRINRALDTGRRVVAVGTTTTRALEDAARRGDGRVQPGAAQAEIFIYPGFDFRVVSGLITNFHLPQSSLLMLVAAFAGRERVLDAYRDAVEHRYRFYSYGDAMLVV